VLPTAEIVASQHNGLATEIPPCTFKCCGKKKNQNGAFSIISITFSCLSRDFLNILNAVEVWGECKLIFLPLYCMTLCQSRSGM